MINIRILNGCVRHKLINPSIYKIFNQTLCSSSDSNNENERKKIEQKVKSEEALKKLKNLLLNQIINDDTSKTQINLAKPKQKPRNSKSEPDTISAKSELIQKKVINAAKDVAESLGGNVKKTESELLSKLLNLTSTSIDQNTKSKKSSNLSDIISGMKVDRKDTKSNASETSRAHQVRQLLERTTDSRFKGDIKDTRTVTKNIRYQLSKSQMEKIDLFGAEPLKIFTLSSDLNEQKNEQVVLKTWDKLQKRELRLAVTHPPENYFQEMIIWTEKGKVWKFPIDNEQGMEEEQNVYFTEHIFLEKHLENWCPTKGPIRHFMELVCVGLSKNHYLSAQAKKDHILWYKDYFLSKKQLLEEVGAIPASKPQEITS